MCNFCFLGVSFTRMFLSRTEYGAVSGRMYGQVSLCVVASAQLSIDYWARCVTVIHCRSNGAVVLAVRNNDYFCGVEMVVISGRRGEPFL